MLSLRVTEINMYLHAKKKTKKKTGLWDHCLGHPVLLLDFDSVASDFTKMSHSVYNACRCLVQHLFAGS